MCLYFLHPDERPIFAAILGGAAERGLTVDTFGPLQWGYDASVAGFRPMEMLVKGDVSIFVFYDPARRGPDGDRLWVGMAIFHHGFGPDVVHTYSDHPEVVALCSPFLSVASLKERFPNVHS